MSSKNHREQLAEIKNNIVNKAFTLPVTASSWKEDGVDHINISRYSKSTLGRLLDFDHARAFDHPILGPFKSINSLWYFIRAKIQNDHIRMLSGAELKDFVYNKCGGLKGGIPNFRAVIMHSAWLRLRSFRDYAAKLKECDLALDSYRRLESGIRVRFEQTPWVVSGYEEIRKALQENREPDFSFLLDKGHLDIYEGVLKMLVPEGSDVGVQEAQPRPPKKAPYQKSKPTAATYDATQIQDIETRHQESVTTLTQMFEAPIEPMVEVELPVIEVGVIETPEVSVTEVILTEEDKSHVVVEMSPETAERYGITV